MNPLEKVKIRQLKKEDQGAIVEIDERVLGENRRDYWVRKLESMSSRSSQVSLVAEVEGKVVGFILGGGRRVACPGASGECRPSTLHG